MCSYAVQNKIGRSDMSVSVGSVTASNFKAEFYVHVAVIKSMLRRK